MECVGFFRGLVKGEREIRRLLRDHDHRDQQRQYQLSINERVIIICGLGGRRKTVAAATRTTDV